MKCLTLFLFEPDELLEDWPCCPERELEFVVERPEEVPEFVDEELEELPVWVAEVTELVPAFVAEVPELGPTGSSAESAVADPLLGSTTVDGKLFLRDVINWLNSSLVLFSWDVLTGLMLHTVTLGNCSTEEDTSIFVL